MFLKYFVIFYKNNLQFDTKNFLKKVKILNVQKLSENECKSYLGCKETQKNHFKSFLDNFRTNLHFLIQNLCKYPKIM